MRTAFGSTPGGVLRNLGDVLVKKSIFEKWSLSKGKAVIFEKMALSKCKKLFSFTISTILLAFNFFAYFLSLSGNFQFSLTAWEKVIIIWKHIIVIPQKLIKRELQTQDLHHRYRKVPVFEHPVRKATWFFAFWLCRTCFKNPKQISSDCITKFPKPCKILVRLFPQFHFSVGDAQPWVLKTLWNLKPYSYLFWKEMRSKLEKFQFCWCKISFDLVLS